MRILVASYAFSPNIGGIENSSHILATAFTDAGNEVRLVTHESRCDATTRSYRVIRRPLGWLLWRLYQWADVVFQNNLSMRFLWPKIITGKRCIITTQTWLSGTAGIHTIASRLKQAVLGRCTNVAISEAVKQSIGHQSTTIGNPYDANIFRTYPDVARRRSLLFVGRLVNDKGLDILVHAVASLLKHGITISLTVAGDGPSRSECEAIACNLGIADKVKYVGTLGGEWLAKSMNEHEILVVPSRWPEPFGIVALEGIACGCTVVGSIQGGLKEAIGDCGFTFPNGNVDALTGALMSALDGLKAPSANKATVVAHLKHFRPIRISTEYVTIFKDSTV